MTHPVVSDADWEVTYRFIGEVTGLPISLGLPSMHQMAEGMEIIRKDTRVSEEQVQNAL